MTQYCNLSVVRVHLILPAVMDFLQLCFNPCHVHARPDEKDTVMTVVLLHERTGLPAVLDRMCRLAPICGEVLELASGGKLLCVLWLIPKMLYLADGQLMRRYRRHGSLGEQRMSFTDPRSITTSKYVSCRSRTSRRLAMPLPGKSAQVWQCN